MSQHDNTNRGAIWKNDDRQSDNHPDFKGSLNVDGVEYWVSAWKRKEGASAKAPALSFSIKLKDDQPRRQDAPARQQPRQDSISTGRPRRETIAEMRGKTNADYSSSGLANDMNDDIPF